MSTTKKLILTRSELEKLPKDELVAIAREAEKLRQASKQKSLDTYLQTAHPGQLKFHKSPKRFRFFGGGNRVGKTTGGTVDFAWSNMGIHPFKKNKIPIQTAIVVIDFENAAKNVLEKKFEERVPPNAIQKIERHQGGAFKKIHWASGSVTDVYSHDQDAGVFEGTRYHKVWCDEPPPRHILTALMRGLIDFGGELVITGTPLFDQDLFSRYSAWLADPERSPWDFLIFDTYINARNIGEGDEELGKSRIKAFESELDPEERSLRIDGSFAQMQGLIFKEWSRATHLIEEFKIPPQWSIIESIDPHPQKPWAVTWTAIDNRGAKILLLSHYIDGSLDEIAQGILMGRAQLPIKDDMRARITRTLIDNASSVPTWHKSFTDPTARRLSVREEMENMIGPRGAGGPRIEVAPKNVHGKIDLFKRWLHTKERGGSSRADFYVFHNEANMAFVKEIEQYRWAKYQSKARSTEAKGQPIKKDDDLIDTVLQVALTIGEGPREAPAIIDMTDLGRGFHNDWQG